MQFVFLKIAVFVSIIVCRRVILVVVKPVKRLV